MHRTFTIFILVVLLCSACSTPRTLNRNAVAKLHRISVVVNATVSNDVSGFTDSIDIPANKELATKILEQVSQRLSSKGFTVTDQLVSIGRPHTDEKFYIISNAAERNLKVNEREVKRGSLYSQRLSDAQLGILLKNVKRKHDINTLPTMGFRSDATLIVQLDGRTISAGKGVAAALANTAIIVVGILGAAAGSGSSPELMATDDEYLAQLRLYETGSGDIIWQNEYRSDAITRLPTGITRLIDSHIAAR